MYEWREKIIAFKRNLIKEFCQRESDMTFLCKLFKIHSIEEIPEQKLDDVLDLCERTEKSRVR